MIVDIYPGVTAGYTAADAQGIAWVPQPIRDPGVYTPNTGTPSSNIAGANHLGPIYRELLKLIQLADADTVVAYTANTVLTAANSGSIVTNDGAAGEVDLTLPAAVKGYKFKAVVAVAQILKFIAAGTDAIDWLAMTGTHLFANEVRATVEIVCYKTGIWTVFNQPNGAWTIG